MFSIRLFVVSKSKKKSKHFPLVISEIYKEKATLEDNGWSHTDLNCKYSHNRKMFELCKLLVLTHSSGGGHTGIADDHYNYQ